MKIRTDFVTNSSSSSFTLSLVIKLKDGKKISFLGDGATFESGPTDSFRDEIFISLDIEQAGRAKGVDELIYYIKNGIYDGDRPRFTDRSSFIQSIRKKVSSMSDINQITMNVTESNFFFAEVTYSYDMSTKKFTVSGTDDYFPSNTSVEGSNGGGIDIRRIKYIPSSPSEAYALSQLPDMVYLKETDLEGRSERIEKLKVGDEVKFKLVPNTENDSNKIEVYHENGSLGFLNPEAGEIIARCMSTRDFKAVVVELVPTAQVTKNSCLSKMKLDVASFPKAEISMSENQSDCWLDYIDLIIYDNANRGTSQNQSNALQKSVPSIKEPGKASDYAIQLARSVSEPVQSIVWEEHNFVHTTCTSEGSIDCFVESKGGVIKQSTVLKTDYLIIGNDIERETVKIKRAKELNQNGKEIKAMTESEFWTLAAQS